MLTFLKKIFVTIPVMTSVSVQNEKLVSLLLTMSQDEHLLDTLLSPMGKLLLINVYHSDFNELVRNILNDNSAGYNSGAISLEYYLKNSTDNLNQTLKRIATILESNKISNIVNSDLTELADSYSELKNLGS